jgi:hypothetical protein
MSADDTPLLPEPGRAFLLPANVIAAFGGSPNVSGVFVSHDGRITIASNGAGLAVRLEPEQCQALGAVLWALGERLAGEQTKAADTLPLCDLAVLGSA